MAAEASEAFAVASGAGRLVEVELAGSVAVEKVGGMIGWLQVQAGRMALLATERGIDFVVTNQTILHVGEVLFA